MSFTPASADSWFQEKDEAVKQAVEETRVELEEKHQNELAAMESKHRINAYNNDITHNNNNNNTTPTYNDIIYVNENVDLEQAFEHFSCIEHVISDRMYQLGKGAEDVFLKYDSDPRTNTITVSDLHKALLDIGIPLTNLELEFIQAKAPVILNEDEEIPNMVQWHHYMSYLDKLHNTSIPPNSKHDAITLLMRRIDDISIHESSRTQAATTRSRLRPVTNSSAPYATEFNSTNGISTAQRIDASIRYVREALYARNISLPLLFRRLKNNQDVVSIETLIGELPKLSFPTDKCSNDEIRAYCEMIMASSQPGPTLKTPKITDMDESLYNRHASSKSQDLRTGLSYTEFDQFFKGKASTHEVENDDEKKKQRRPITDDPSMIRAVAKLSSMPLREHFGELDINKDRFLTYNAILEDLINLGLSREYATGANKETVIEYIRKFGDTSAKGLTYAEYVEFANSKVGVLQPPKVMLNITIPDDTTPQECVQIIHKATMHGIDLQTVFEEYAPINTTRISEEDVWHAFQSIGVNISKDVSHNLFSLFDPIEEIIQADGTVFAEDGVDNVADPDYLEKKINTINYQELALTIHKPNTYSRVGTDKNNAGAAKHVLRSGSNIPLGAEIPRLDEEYAQSISNLPESRKKYSALRSKHSHKFDDDILSVEEESDRISDEDPEKRKLRNISNISNLDLAYSELQKQQQELKAVINSQGVQDETENTSTATSPRQKHLQTKFASSVTFGEHDEDTSTQRRATRSVRGVSKSMNEILSIPSALPSDSNIDPNTMTAEEVEKLRIRAAIHQKNNGNSTNNILLGVGAFTDPNEQKTTGTRVTGTPNKSSIHFSHEMEDGEVPADDIFSSRRRKQADASSTFTRQAGRPSITPVGDVDDMDNHSAKNIVRHQAEKRDFSIVSHAMKEEDIKDNESATLVAQKNRPMGNISTIQFGLNGSNGVAVAEDNLSASIGSTAGPKAPRAAYKHSHSSDNISTIFDHRQNTNVDIDAAEIKNRVDNDVFPDSATKRQEYVSDVQSSALNKLRLKYAATNSASEVVDNTVNTVSNVDHSTTMNDDDHSLDIIQGNDVPSTQNEQPMEDDIIYTSPQEIMRENVAQLAHLIFARGRSKQLFLNWTHGSSTMNFENFELGAKDVGSSLSQGELRTIFMTFVPSQNNPTLSYGQFMVLLSAGQE